MNEGIKTFLIVMSIVVSILSPSLLYFIIIFWIIFATLFKNKNITTKKTTSKKKLKNVLFNKTSDLEFADMLGGASDDDFLDLIIEDELKKNNINKKYNLNNIFKKKLIATIIFSFINFIFLASIFFHFPSYKYVLEIINIVVYIHFMRKFNIVNYLKKEIKSRPTENISYIISSMVTGNICYINNILVSFVLISFSFVIACFTFYNPHILYEKVDGGYYVRFYTAGITNYETVTIPETYKDESVIGIRGNVFKDMIFLKEVSLPETIEVIRGSAFKNCSSLEKINLPSKITEIKGNTFENCSSLKRINIPDNVTRIGGHAFYGDTALSEVLISENSKLSEIGSSAFRDCGSLKSITIPKNTNVNKRAFKESPTIVNRYEDTTINGYVKNNDLEKNYTLVLDQTQIINSDLSLTLASFESTNKDQDSLTGLKGVIKIELNKKLYYFYFQTSYPQKSKYSVGKYNFEIISGSDKYVGVKINY